MYKDEEKKFDIRVTEKYLGQEGAAQNEYQEYLKNLPDVAAKLDEEYYLNLAEFEEVKREERPPAPPEQGEEDS